MNNKKCIDCAHFCVCRKITSHIDDSVAESCIHYLHKESLVNLPCNVGDTVYRICGPKKNRFVAPHIVISIHIHYNNSFVICTDGAWNILGKDVFLSIDEANE